MLKLRDHSLVLTNKLEIHNLETIIQQLESEMRNVETTIECQTLKRVTINFLQILKSRANAKIQALRQTQNTGTSNQ